MTDSLPCAICGDPVYFDGTDPRFVAVDAHTIRYDEADEVEEYYLHAHCFEGAAGGWRSP